MPGNDERSPLLDKNGQATSCCNCDENSQCNTASCKCWETRCSNCKRTSCHFKTDAENAINGMNLLQARKALKEIMLLIIPTFNSIIFSYNSNEAEVPQWWQQNDIPGNGNGIQDSQGDRAGGQPDRTAENDTTCFSRKKKPTKCPCGFPECKVKKNDQCEKRTDVENFIMQMTEDKPKSAITELLNDYGEELDDAIFSNTSAEIPPWYNMRVKIRSIDHFFLKADNLAHFEVDRCKCCCKVCRYKHHYLTIGRNDKNVTVVHYNESFFNGFFGIGEVKSEIYDKSDKELNSSIDEGNLKLVIHPCMPDSEKEQLRRMLQKIGERFYDVQDNNCEHFVNYVLHGEYKAPFTKEKGCALFANLLVSNLTYFSLYVTLIISFVGTSLSSIVRQSYVRILVALIVSFKRGDSFDSCTSKVGQSIQHNAKLRIEREREVLQNDYKEHAIDNITSFFDTALVCEKAEALGYETLTKSTIHLLVIWCTLQTAFILAYNYIQLKPLRLICIQRGKLYLYRKYLYREVFGGYIPIFVSLTCVRFIQYGSGYPIIAYFFVICVIAFIVKLIVVLIIEAMFRFSRGRHDKHFSVILISLLVLGYIICVIFHYSDPAKIDPF